MATLTTTNHPLLQLSGITKSFGGTRALLKGELSLFPGQVTALLGENGAGKSTLVKVLTGVHQPDGGEIRIDDRSVRIHSPAAAQQLGISVIHQESVLFDDLSVAENIFITAPPLRRRLIDWRDMRRRAAALLAQLEARVDPAAPLRQLSVAQKHLVQIARALSHDARIIIMDEPTAALSKHEADELLQMVRRLRAAGRAVLYISHKFEEVFAIADRYAVFRDGAAVGEGLMAQTTLDELVKVMVGRSLQQAYPKQSANIGAEVLRVEGLGRGAEYVDVNLSVHSGEIIGIYGLVGAGRSEVMHSLFGLTQPDCGRVLVNGQCLQFKHPGDATAAGIAYVPEDRQGQGAILSHSIAANITLPALRDFARVGWLRTRQQHAIATQWAKRLQVKCNHVDQAVQELSGGNQQKVVLAKWLLTAPKVLILDEPTKGIDVGAKATVHGLISELAGRGLAVIMVSSELPEILGMADRIVVMRRGRVRGSFERGARAEDILRAATDA